MKSKLNFIYLDGGLDYYQKKIILDKREIKVEDIYLDLDCIKSFDRFKKVRRITNEMDNLVLNNEVIMSSCGFTAGDAIITTGGIILGSSLSTVISSSASKKRDNRIKCIDKHFIDKSYSKNRAKCYSDNLDVIDNLLDIYKKFLTGGFKGEIEDYIELLSCLIESVEPIKSKNYEEKVKRLLKEYPIY